jgi:RNA polymerase-binding protein DksA
MDDAAHSLALDRVNRQFLHEHPAQAADVIDGFGHAAAVEVLAAHDADTLVHVWRHLSPARIDEIVPALPEKLLKQTLHALDPGVLAISLPRISEESRSRCLALLPRRAEADMGATSFERDQELTVVANEREMLAQIERALERIDDGTYGVCESCGNPIGKMRVMAFPRATLCMTCKQREERR